MMTVTLFDFSKQKDLSQWKIQNDTVMGGRSTSHLVINEDGNGVFAGSVSLENNGGFAMMQHHFDTFSVTQFSKVLLRLKGDGKRYQFRVKRTQEDRHSYIKYFETTGDWETIVIKLKDMVPQYRGRKLDLPHFNASHIAEIAFLIGNKQAEDFTLEIDKIMVE